MSIADRIVLAMGTSRFSMLSVSDIAYSAGVARSTVYRLCPGLIRAGLLQHTSLQGQYALSGNGQRLAVQLAEQPTN